MTNLYKNKTVTIGVSALNEEQNIVQFLHSILSQKEVGFTIEKIIVISDGSTDKTVLLARSINDSRIEVREYGERLGQPARINELFKSLGDDILVKCDADTILGNTTSIAELITFFSDEKVGMVCGSGRPLNPRTIMEKSVAITREAYMSLIKINNGHTRHFVNGRLMAFRKELAEQITIPTETIGNDVYCYFDCLTKGYEFRRAGSAIVYYRPPSTIGEHIWQNTRFISVSEKMYKYFPKNLVDKECTMPKFKLLIGMARQVILHPFLTIFIFSLNSYCRYLRFSKSHNLTSNWRIAQSSKHINI